MSFVVEGYIEKGKCPEISLDLIEKTIRTCGINAMPQAIEIAELPFTSEKYIHLLWDDKWGISIHFNYLNDREHFQAEAQLYAEIASKENCEQAEIIRNADRKLHIVMGDDPDDIYTSNVGIIMTEVLQDLTGCVYFNPTSKQLF